MNYFNIQTNLFKNAQAKYLRKKKFQRTFYYKTENKIFLSDGKYIIVIPKDACMLDLPSVAEPGDFLYRIIESQPNVRDTVTRTNRIECIEEEKCVIFENSAGDEIFIDEKYLKDFDNDIYVSYRCEGPVSPLYIYEYDEIVGVVMPMKKI